ncbi:expressed unknown protein [Seminavis robusta]|uniref:Uncharacterized protein n=1 Tax=Seminavis robusta TaxID=568900 RepID=A0A9N8HHM2_9STRA|nr:expressed unknown protein [Seminavis robusta]|eukprot:Sro646_g180740.1 n/a (224) ;mRNA; f:28638-29309
MTVTTSQHTTRSTPPAPREGFFLNQLDTFIGPGATTAEIFLQFGASFVIGLLCFWIKYDNDATEVSTNWKHNAIVIGLGMDMIGGVVTNSTSAAKRWYHRPGQNFSQHMTFIAIHAMQIGTVAFLFCPQKDQQWFYFAAVYGCLLVSSTIVHSVPLYLQRPMAMSLVATAIPMSMSKVLPETPGMEWFIPLLFLKLLVSHLTPETSFQPGEAWHEENARAKNV